MDIIYYIIHRAYNALRELIYPSLVRYKKFKAERKQRKRGFWKIKQYPPID